MGKDGEVLLGQPAAYPSAMVDALTALLSKHRGVKAAYLALMHDPAVDEVPHLVVGLEMDTDSEDVFREAGLVASDTSPGGGPVDLVRVRSGEAGISDYLLRTTMPFYERTWDRS